MAHRDKSLWPWIDIECKPGHITVGDVHIPITDDAAAVGTEVHKEIERLAHVSDAHVGMDEQLLVYGTMVPAEGIALIMGGDYLHGEMHGPDAIIVRDGVEYHLDYKTTAKRVLQHMDARRYIPLDMPVEPEVVKPQRAPRARDWEQRNRKQRR